MANSKPSGGRAEQAIVEVARKPTARRPAPVDSYHHGTLKAALLDATEQILLEQGIEDFTLRACARRAGVSHGAPAHHFGDVRGLLTEFAALGFERLTAMLQSYRDKAAPDAELQCSAVGQAYIDFALAHRAQFQLMFRADRINEDDPHLIAASMAAYDQFDSAMANLLNKHGGFDDAALAKQLLAWSAVHGFAALLLEGRLRNFFDGKPQQQFADQMGTRMLDLLNHALISRKPGSN